MWRFCGFPDQNRDSSNIVCCDWLYAGDYSIPFPPLRWQFCGFYEQNRDSSNTLCYDWLYILLLIATTFIRAVTNLWISWAKQQHVVQYCCSFISLCDEITVRCWNVTILLLPVYYADDIGLFSGIVVVGKWWCLRCGLVSRWFVWVLTILCLYEL